MTLEFTECPDVIPGKDKSWVTRFFGTNSPDSLTPSCSATPNGDRTRPGMHEALSIGKSNSQPFVISFRNALPRNSVWTSADLWLPQEREPDKSPLQSDSSNVDSGQSEPFSKICFNVTHHR